MDQEGYLQENNQSLPFASAYSSILQYIESAPCNYVLWVNPAETCSFVRNTSSCHYFNNYLDYMEFLFCTLDGTNPLKLAGGISLLCLWLIFLTYLLVVILKDHYCPAIFQIGNFIPRFKNYIVGYLILPIMNNILNLFLHPHMVKDDQLFYNHMLGANIFNYGVIGGISIILNPFHLVESFVIRDHLLLLLAIVWPGFVMTMVNSSNIWPIATIIVYTILLLIIIGDPALIYRNYRKYKMYIEKCIYESDAPNGNLLQAISIVADYEDYTKNDLNENHWKLIKLGHVSPLFHSDPNERNRHLWNLATPVNVILSLIWPTFDPKINLNGWSKVQTVINFSIFPIFILFTVNALKYWCYGLIVSIPFPLIIYFTTNSDYRPKWHKGLVIMSLTGSMLGIYLILSEFRSVVQTLSFLLKARTSFKSAIFLVWGYISNILIVKIIITLGGYPQVAFASLISGTLMRNLFNFGITLFDRDEILYRGHGLLTMTSQVFIELLVVLTLFALITNRYNARRSIGTFMLIIYIIYFIFCFLTNLEVINAYGTGYLVYTNID